jgi:hypothetical protein
MDEYKEIYIEDKLQDIRYKIKNEHIKLNDLDKVKKTNQMMMQVLSKLYDEESNKQDIMTIFNIISKDDNNKKKDVDKTLVLYYFAIYNDNVSLLRELLGNDYSFDGPFNSINLYALDKNISSKFNKDKYISLLKKYNNIFRNFYYSIKDDLDNVTVLDRFANIMRSKPEVIRGCDNHIYDRLLTKGTLEFFDSDYLKNATDNQKRIINYVSDIYDYKTYDLSYVKILLSEYPQFNKSFYVGLIPYFSVDELASMSEEDTKIFGEASFNNLVPRLLEIKSINPNFTCPLGFINIRIFNVLSNKEIAHLDNDVMVDICNYNIFVGDSLLKEEEFNNNIKAMCRRSNTKKFLIKKIFKK